MNFGRIFAESFPIRSTTLKIHISVNQGLRENLHKCNVSEEPDRDRFPYSALGEAEHDVNVLAAHLLTNRVILVPHLTQHYHLHI